MTLYEYIQKHWGSVRENPTSDAVQRYIRNYALALMQKRKYYNPEAADDIASGVLTTAAEKLFPEWEKVTAATYGAFLTKATQYAVRKFFAKYAIAKRKERQQAEAWFEELKRIRKAKEGKEGE